MGNEADTNELEADRAAAAGRAADAVHLLEAAVRADPGRFAAWMKLSAMKRATGDEVGALAAIDRALAVRPLDFSALLARAMLLDRQGDGQAGEAFSRAIAQLPPDEKVPPAMASAITLAKRKSEAHQAACEAAMLSAAGPLADDAVDRAIRRFASNSARRTRHFHQEPTHFHYSGLPEVEFHECEQFPGLARLEAATADIKAEFEALIECEAAEIAPYIQYPDQAPLRQWEALNQNKDWSALHLLQNGNRVEANARHCPVTMDVLESLPQPRIPGASPNAMFSLLAPRTRIPPHTGVANIRLVCHLPLIVPPDCGFRVGATTVEWREGEAFVFDDTIEHEAWNSSDQLRVVFICDLWVPQLSERERDAVARIIPAAGAGFSGGL
ncbi:aspartyl/asparaginyl beta-hydroxylase domain-containing protein [Sphingomonas edaphi]|uniref:Aspartyl/asparaginyl beta-hydroxylase domain-containing protein n=2 Tax=Sphingomonas edaphi TaxID=2315689 RepID=A0A418Q4A9_9SPHN|nr:aspartyl/asparaginyl beta-hydroxylase domain-containing protein [Sphingomonas edaphi]